MGKNDPNAIKKIAADSWIPKMNTAKGTHTGIGTARRKLINPSHKSSMTAYQPMSTPRATPVTDAIANPAATRSRLMRTYTPHVPEYHARVWGGPQIQSHHAIATLTGEGSEALDTQPAAVTASQAIRIAAGSAVRRARRQSLFRGP